MAVLPKVGAYCLATPTDAASLLRQGNVVDDQERPGPTRQTIGTTPQGGFERLAVSDTSIDEVIQPAMEILPMHTATRWILLRSPGSISPTM